MRIIRVLLIVLAVGVTGMGVLLYTGKNRGQSVGETLGAINIVSTPTSTSTPTPMPFQEMTIPYLRSRIYESKLGGREVAYENENYTAYITSYTSDGLLIRGLLTIPKGVMIEGGLAPRSPDVRREEGGWPAIIFVHGYIPPETYKTTENYYDYVDYLARNGFVVFKIDLRGHGVSEGEPGGSYYSSDYIVDTLNARAALQSSDFVNPGKIGLWGHSMAGNVLFRAFAAKPEIPAVVIWAGAVYSYTDWEYGISDNSYRPPSNDTQRQRKRRELFNTHGQFNPESPFWKQVAATNYIADLKGALQIHHAVNDPVVSIEYSRNLMRLMEGSSVIHELQEYADGGHNISGSNFTTAMQRTVEFFRKRMGS